MAKIRAFMANGGGSNNVWKTTGTYDNSAQATITDCPFSPDMVYASCYQDNNNRCVDVGGNTFGKFSAGLSAGTSYIFPNYGITISGNTITIASGFAIARNKQFELVAVKNE